MSATNQFLSSLSEAQTTGTSEVSYSVFGLVELLGHSLIIGAVLFAVSYYFSLKSASGNGAAVDKIALVLGNSNLMYLCTGLTAVMILVNNNLARAFSIGAAIALTRFRIKVGQKTNIANILFGIIAGIACGLNEIELAWILTIIYVILCTVFYLMIRKIESK